MAEYHFSVTNISRRGGTAAGASEHRSGKPQDAVSAAVYRNGQTLTNEQTGITYRADKSSYGMRIVSSFIVAPESAPAWSRATQSLWNEVDRAEKRVDSLLAYDHNVMLPYEWTQKEREERVAIFVHERFVAKGLVAEVSFHKFGSSYSPDAKAWRDRLQTLPGVPFYERHNEPKDATAPYVLTCRNRTGEVSEYYVFQPHCHILTPTRVITPEGFSPHKMRAPDGQNNKRWEGQRIKDLRQDWADHANKWLEPHQQISAKTLRAQGIDRIPQRGWGMAATKLERTGNVTEAGEYFRAIQQMNAERQRLKLEHSFRDAEVSTLKPKGRAMEHETPEQVSDRQYKQQAEYIERMQRQERAANDFALEQARLSAERIEAAKTEFQKQQDKAAKEANLYVEALDRQKRNGAVADPYLRYAIATGEAASGRWDDNLLGAAGRESAMFLRDQQEGRAKLADPNSRMSDVDKQALELKLKIQHLEYNSVGDARTAGYARVVGGKVHTERAEQLEGQSKQNWKEAEGLRAERADLLKEQEQTRRAEMAGRFADLSKDPTGARAKAEGRDEVETRSAADARQTAGRKAEGAPSKDKEAVEMTDAKQSTTSQFEADADYADRMKAERQKARGSGGRGR